MGAIGEGMDLEVESGKRFMFNLGDRALKSGKEKAKMLMKLLIEKRKEGKLVDKPYDDRFIISIDELKERGNMKKIDGTLREEMLEYLEPYCRKYHVQIALAINEQDGKNDCYIFFEGKDASTIDMCIDSAIKDFERDEALKREADKGNLDLEKNKKEVEKTISDKDPAHKEDISNKALKNKNKASKSVKSKTDRVKRNKGNKRANRKARRRTIGFLDETNGSMIKALDKNVAIANANDELLRDAKEKVKKHEPLSR